MIQVLKYPERVPKDEAPFMSLFRLVQFLLKTFPFSDNPLLSRHYSLINNIKVLLIEFAFYTKGRED
jgi:hypothetical protein